MRTINDYRPLNLPNKEFVFFKDTLASDLNSLQYALGGNKKYIITYNSKITWRKTDKNKDFTLINIIPAGNSVLVKIIVSNWIKL